MQETWVQSLGQEAPLEKEMAPHSSTLAWKIPWVEEPGRVQSMGSQRVRHDWATSLHLLWQSTYDKIYHLNHFKMYSSEALSLLVVLCTHHHHPSRESFHLPKLMDWAFLGSWQSQVQGEVSRSRWLTARSQAPTLAAWWVLLRWQVWALWGREDPAAVTSHETSTERGTGWWKGDQGPQSPESEQEKGLEN